MAASALLVDFGGVLTSSVFESFAAFCESQGLPGERFVSMIGEDKEARRLLHAVEVGEISEAEFERAFAPVLGPGVVADGLITGLTGALRRDEEMIEAIASLRRAGVRTVLVSNSLGLVPYEGWGLEALFDVQVISGTVGLRKPEPEIYEMALREAGARPVEAVFVDDLAHNVDAAVRLGLTGIHHTDTRQTLRLLAAAFESDPGS